MNTGSSTRRKSRADGRAPRGFTLIELLVGVAVMAVIVVLAAPSFRELIDMQRLRGTNAQLVTDVQYARSEAVSRQGVAAISFDEDQATTCYTVHSCGVPLDANCRCDCLLGEGARCWRSNTKELRTVQIDRSSKIEVQPERYLNQRPNLLVFDPITGGMQSYYIGIGSGAFQPAGEAWTKTSLTRTPTVRSLRTMVSVGGRPSVCTPASEFVSGVTACVTPPP